MTCCAKFLRSYLLLGCVFDMGLGIAILVFTSQIDNLDKNLIPEDRIELLKKSLTTMYAAGGAAIATGLFGIYAFLKNQKFLQSLFIILNIIFCSFFGAVFAATLLFSKIMDENLSQSTCSTGYLKDTNEVFLQLKQLWCRVGTISQDGQTVPASCGCYIENFNQWSPEEKDQLQNKFLYSNIQHVKSPLVTSNVQECSFFSQITTDQKTIDMLKWVEDEFSCTGICEGDIIYYFNDINSGKPNTSSGCAQAIRDKAEKYMRMLNIGALIIAIICLINFMFAFFNCCFGNKRIDVAKNYLGQ